MARSSRTADLAHPSLVIIGATGGAAVASGCPARTRSGRPTVAGSPSSVHTETAATAASRSCPRAAARRACSAGSSRPSGWAPDSQQLAYVHYDGRSQSSDSLATVSVAETANHPLVLDAAPGADRPPVWSPDGARIAFTGINLETSGRMGIYVVGPTVLGSVDRPSRARLLSIALSEAASGAGARFARPGPEAARERVGVVAEPRPRRQLAELRRRCRRRARPSRARARRSTASTASATSFRQRLLPRFWRPRSPR